jgi:hypothetical protein
LFLFMAGLAWLIYLLWSPCHDVTSSHDECSLGHYYVVAYENIGALVAGWVGIFVVGGLMLSAHYKPDRRPCPRCGYRVEVGDMVCPQCQFDFWTIGPRAD